MMSRAESEQRVLSQFKKQKVFTTKDLMGILGCSIATVGRRIREWDAHTSYNMNGRFYTLRDVPEFDGYGIWECKGALFSKHGSLKETLKQLVNKSGSGLSTIELGEILQLPPHTVQSVLCACREQIATKWHRFDGLNIYLSDQPRVYEAQYAAREGLLEQSAKLDIPSDSDAVIIFVELIKHPKDKLELLVRRVRRRSANITIEKVRNLLTYHGILKKNSGIPTRKKSHVSH